MTAVLSARPRHPSERFILFLLTQEDPDECHSDVVLAQLDACKLPPVEEAHVDALRFELLRVVPTPFMPRNRRHQKSMDFLRQFGVYDLHHPNPGVEEAASILADYSVRRRVEIGLLGRVSHSLIAKEIGEQQGVDLTEEGVGAYEHFFWDVSTMSLEEWAAIIDQQPIAALIRDSQLSALQCGGKVALSKMGLAPSVDPQEMIQDMLRRVYLNFVEVDKVVPLHKDKVTMLTGLASMGIALYKQATTSEHALRRLLRDFERMKMETNDENTPALSDLVDKDGSCTDTADIIPLHGERKKGS
jgi:hypothetical protein